MSHYLNFFKEQGVLDENALRFLKVLSLFDQTVGSSVCWCVKRCKNKELLKGFVTSHPSHPMYLGKDARPLLLAIVGQYLEHDKPVIVRRACCSSKHCVNPLHYFYGTKRDVAVQQGIRKGTNIGSESLEQILAEHQKGRSYSWIAREYKLPYHTVRRACRNELPQ